MKRFVTWSREALDDIKQQVAFIAQDNPAAARRLADRIRDTGQGLGRHGDRPAWPGNRHL